MPGSTPRPPRLWVCATAAESLAAASCLEVIDPAERSARESEQTDSAVAPTPGTVVSVAFDAEAEVSAGDVLMVIESMKMQSEITAWRDGVLERVHQRVGETFNTGAPLVSLVPEDADDEEESS